MDFNLVEDWDVDVTLFVPCYNEEKNIIPTIEKIVESCKQVNCTYEILVIDDASTDRSVEEVRRFRSSHSSVPIRLICNSINRGLARNFAEGAHLGRGKYYRIVCGDDVEPIATQVAILTKMGQADLVIPYPIKVQNKSWLRKLLSRTYTRIVNLVSGFRLPYWNGCALYLRHHVMCWHPNTRGFGFQARLVSRLLALGCTFVEIGCTYNERRHSTSNALTLRNLASVINCLWSILLQRLSTPMNNGDRNTDVQKNDTLLEIEHRSLSVATSEVDLSNRHSSQ